MSESAVQFWMTDDTARPEGRTSEAELPAFVERACTGDVSAFEQVMFRTERSVMMTARRLLGNVADAEEATQEVFLRVFKYLHRFDHTRAFEPWLYRLTVNVCNDIGSRRTRSTEANTAEPHERTATGSDPHQVLHSDERRRMLHSALDDLPHKQRAAVVLRDLQGLSTADVAAALNITEATVRSHLSAARLRMKRFIEKQFRRCR